MYTLKLIKLLPSTICVVLTWAPYSGGEVENAIINHIRNMILDAKKSGECLDEAAYNEIVRKLHELILKTGDRDEYKQKFQGIDGYKWYKASCQLLLVNAFEHNANDYYEYAYIGEMPLYQYNKADGKLHAVNFIHNIRNEIMNNTIEDTYLAPFHSRNNRDIAKQMMPCEGDELIDMVSNCDREEFIAKIAHSITRIIGNLREEAPHVTYGKRKLDNEDLLVFYMPKTGEGIPFMQEKLDEIVRQKFFEEINCFRDIGDYLDIALGDMITIGIINKTISIKM